VRQAQGEAPERGSLAPRVDVRERVEGHVARCKAVAGEGACKVLAKEKAERGERRRQHWRAPSRVDTKEKPVIQTQRQPTRAPSSGVGPGGSPTGGRGVGGGGGRRGSGAARQG